MWPDVAKGVSIVGVVLLHVSLAVPEGMESAYADANHVLDPLRMPLFFLISGFFSGKILRYTAWDLFARRLWFFLVPYVVWAVVEMGSYALLLYHWDGFPLPSFADLGLRVVTGDTMYWFLPALIAFTTIGWATRRLPAWAVMLVSLGPVLLLPWVEVVPIIVKAALFLPAYLAGLRFADAVARHGEHCLRPRHLAVSAVTYLLGLALWAATAPAMGALALRLDPLGLPWAAGDIGVVVSMVRQMLMLPLAVTGAVLLAKVPGVAAVLSWIGRNTLVIYLAHPLALTWLFLMPWQVNDLGIGLTSGVLWHTHTWIWICFLYSAVAAVVVHRLQKTPVVGWTLRPPPIHTRADVRELARASWAGVSLPFRAWR